MSNIFYTNGDSPEMIRAFEQAQKTFKYFWREVSWEARRIVPALDMAYAKVAFVQETQNPASPRVEYMWVSDIGFDGDTISGILINSPGIVNHVEKGDYIEAPLNRLSDWLFASDDVAYGGFTIQVLRSGMNEEEREEHDDAWGLDFGDPGTVLLVRNQEERPDALIEHPMSINMKGSLADFLKHNPQELNNSNEDGYTLLHRESIAGNKSSVEVLLEMGADTKAATRTGKTALDFARQLNWDHLIPLLETSQH